MIVLVVIIGFPLLGPLGKTAAVVFVIFHSCYLKTPFNTNDRNHQKCFVFKLVKHPGRGLFWLLNTNDGKHLKHILVFYLLSTLAENCFDFFNKSDGISSNMCVFLICCPLAGDFCWRRGWGRGGIHFGINLGSFWNHFGINLNIFEIILGYVWTILGSPMPPKYIFQPKINFLEIAHTNFVFSIRIAP